MFAEYRRYTAKLTKFNIFINTLDKIKKWVYNINTLSNGVTGQKAVIYYRLNIKNYLEIEHHKSDCFLSSLNNTLRHSQEVRQRTLTP